MAVTGVSGSGKSTLVTEILYRALARELNGARETPGAHDALEGAHHVDKIIEIDQSPIGRTPRSNPATYTGLFGTIRELFAGVPESRVRGYLPGRFSFNVKGGRCENCKGDGILKIEMQFLPDVYVPCEVCKGKRYNREALEIHYRGHSIADVLDMTIEEALDVFGAVPKVATKLRTMVDVGLGYVHLGQPATTLSGGEAQRVKLSTELSRRATGKTLYVLDEPTTGLHFADVEKLLQVLHRLVDAGNTVVVIEHNLDVIKTADWIVDLGPEGGTRGGAIVAEGTPEEVAARRWVGDRRVPGPCPARRAARPPLRRHLRRGAGPGARPDRRVDGRGGPDNAQPQARGRRSQPGEVGPRRLRRGPRSAPWTGGARAGSRHEARAKLRVDLRVGRYLALPGCAAVCTRVAGILRACVRAQVVPCRSTWPSTIDPPARATPDPAGGASGPPAISGLPGRRAGLRAARRLCCSPSGCGCCRRSAQPSAHGHPAAHEPPSPPGCRPAADRAHRRPTPGRRPDTRPSSGHPAVIAGRGTMRACPTSSSPSSPTPPRPAPGRSSVSSAAASAVLRRARSRSAIRTWRW